MLTTYHTYGYISNHFRRRRVAIIDMPWSCERGRHLAGDESDYKGGPGQPAGAHPFPQGSVRNPGGRSRKSPMFRPIQKIRLATADQCSHQNPVTPAGESVRKMPLAGAYFFVIPGWSVGPGPEPMNTGHPKLAEVCVPGFRALGLRPSPGMTGISDFLTASKAAAHGRTGSRPSPRN